MLPIGLVFVGGGLGAVLRYGMSIGVTRLAGTGFPFATLSINVFGSFLMGLVVAWFAFRGEGGQEWRLFLTTGVLGGYTTFSAFSLETALMIERRAYGTAAGYAGGSVLLSVTALFVGLMLARRVFS